MYEKIEKAGNLLDKVPDYRKYASAISDIMVRMADDEDGDLEESDDEQEPFHFDADVIHQLPVIDLTTPNGIAQICAAHPGAEKILLDADLIGPNGEPSRKYNSEDKNYIEFGPYTFVMPRGYGDKNVSVNLLRSLVMSDEMANENAHTSLHHYLDVLDPSKNKSQRRHVKLRNMGKGALQAGEKPQGAEWKPVIIDGKMPKKYYDQVAPGGHMLGFNPFMYKHMYRRTPGSQIETMPDISGEYMRQLKPKKAGDDWTLEQQLKGIYDKYPDSNFDPINYSHRRFNPYSVLNMETTSMGREHYPSHRSNWYIPKKKMPEVFTDYEPMDYDQLTQSYKEKYPNLF